MVLFFFSTSLNSISLTIHIPQLKSLVIFVLTIIRGYTVQQASSPKLFNITYEALTHLSPRLLYYRQLSGQPAYQWHNTFLLSPLSGAATTLLKRLLAMLQVVVWTLHPPVSSLKLSLASQATHLWSHRTWFILERFLITSIIACLFKPHTICKFPVARYCI